jgi:hypothetical protein
MISEVSQVGKLVHELELRLGQLPDQTLRLLADLIQAHLSSQPKVPAQ